MIMTDFRLIRTMPATAFLFPGQGSQHVGMMQEMAASFAVARATFEETDDILGLALSKLCVEGPEDALTDTINAQPALLAASVAAMRCLEQQLAGLSIAGAATAEADAPPATFVAGHSMGEYSALVAAGSLTFADALRLVRIRGRLMKEAGQAAPGMMAAVLGLDEADVAAVCAAATLHGGIAQVANDNCPGQVVISGDEVGMNAAMAALSSAGAKKVMPLAVSIAAHSPLMLPAAQELRSAIEATTIVAPAIPVIGNTNARVLSTVDEIRSELTAQLTGSVRWTGSMQTAIAGGATTFVEIGPGEVLSGLLKRIDRKMVRFSINNPEKLQEYVASLQN